MVTLPAPAVLLLTVPASKRMARDSAMAERVRSGEFEVTYATRSSVWLDIGAKCPWRVGTPRRVWKF